MSQFLLRRLLQSAVLFWAIMTITFALVQLAPGGPEGALIDLPNAPKELIASLREFYGLDQPLHIRYVNWLAGVARFDFGRSYSNAARPVVDVILERAGPTVQLSAMAFLIGLLGIPIGIVAAFHRGQMPDNLIRILTVVGQSVPTWWLSLSVIVAMSSLIGWFPNGQGRGSPWEWFRYIIVPAILLSIGGIIAFSRYVRSEVLETLNQDYVRTARAKGLAPPVVSWVHVMRNALMPVVTLLGGLLPGLLGGAIITEFIFNWPGMGKLFFEAASTRDYPLLLGILTLATFLTIIGTLIADLLYGVVDPRIRYG